MTTRRSSFSGLTPTRTSTLLSCWTGSAAGWPPRRLAPPTPPPRPGHLTQRYGQVTTAGVEGTGSYGYRLAQHLMAEGISVVEVNRPDRARRRRQGKADPVDAEAAARAVLAGDARAVPKTATAPQGSCAPWWWPAPARSRPAPRPPTRSVRCCGRPRRTPHPAAPTGQGPPGPGVRPACARHRAAAGPGQPGPPLAGPHDEITDLDAAITTTLRRTAPRLLERHRVGVQTAAQLLITAGDNPDRLHSEAALAAICGAARSRRRRARPSGIG
jgi:transposase